MQRQAQRLVFWRMASSGRELLAPKPGRRMKKSRLAVVCVVFDQGLRTCIYMRPSHPRKHEKMRAMLPHVQGNQPPCKTSRDSNLE